MLWKRGDKAAEAEAAEAKAAAIEALEEASKDRRYFWQGAPPRGADVVTASAEIERDGARFIAKVLAVECDSGETRLSAEIPIETAHNEQSAYYGAKRFIEAFAADNDLTIDGNIATNVKLPVVRVNNRGQSRWR